MPGIVVKFGELNKFNTGCHYSLEGQPITWATFEAQDVDTTRGIEGIVYQDYARGITMCIPLPSNEGFTQREGIKKYVTLWGLVNHMYVKNCESIGLEHKAADYKSALPHITLDVECQFRHLVGGR